MARGKRDAKPRRGAFKATAKTLSEYLAVVEQVWMKWTKAADHIADIWFRGHADATWELLPGSMRDHTFKTSEHRYRHDFYLRAQPFLQEATVPPATEWDWYFLMQHYGVPTRLIDWSESALVALYFAVKPDLPGDGCIWMLDPRGVNNELCKIGSFVPIYTDKTVQPYLPSLWDESEGLIPSSPIAIDPPQNSRRLAAQRGKFTVHGSEMKALETYDELQQYLLRVDIPARAKGPLLRQLLVAGVTESVLFPGLAGLSNELRDAYSRGFHI